MTTISTFRDLRRTLIIIYGSNEEATNFIDSIDLEKPFIKRNNLLYFFINDIKYKANIELQQLFAKNKNRWLEIN